MDAKANVVFLRMKYLDQANMNFTMGLGSENPTYFKECEGNLDNFLDTIDAEKPEGMIIQKEFDRIEEEKHKRLMELNESIEDKGELEMIDVNTSGRMQIYIDSLHDKRTVCWNVAIEKGLFHG